MILALNGGGMRGGLQVGALSELARQTGEPQVHKLFPGGVYGISVGAIVGSYVAFGFSMDEISQIILAWAGVPLSPPNLRSILEISRTHGLDDGSFIHDRLRETFSKRGMNFDELRIGDALIPLHIVASDCLNVRTVIFGKSVKVWDAIRSSTAIPLVYKPHEFECGTFSDGAVLCDNICNVIPRADRDKVLFLLITRTIPLTIDAFMETFHVLKTMRGCQTIWKTYPKNTCMLIDDETAAINIWASKESAVSVAEKGASLFREFYSGIFRGSLAPNAVTMNSS
jgi:predicted patatin/cPLA2 family phospholipase